MENNNQNPQVAGDLGFADQVIQKIITRALESVPGVLAAKGGFASDLADKLVNRANKTDGVSVEVGQEEVAADLDIVVEYDQDLPRIQADIKQLAYDEIKLQTGLEVIEVNVNVTDIMTRQEFEQSQVSLQDKLAENKQAPQA